MSCNTTFSQHSANHNIYYSSPLITSVHLLAFTVTPALVSLVPFPLVASCPYFYSSSIDHGTLQSQAWHYPPAGISRILQAALSCCQPLQTPLPLSSCSVKNLLLSPEVLISSNGICSQKQRQYTGLVHRNSHEPSTLSGEKY